MESSDVKTELETAIEGGTPMEVYSSYIEPSSSSIDLPPVFSPLTPLNGDSVKMTPRYALPEAKRAMQIRIKQYYVCEERRVQYLSAPFAGFVAHVKFQCRARQHVVQTLNGSELASYMKRVITKVRKDKSYKTP
ncbi:hypothetical protein WR25_06827 [Diploscapter pachys]|uniref:Uncharacterized protein n=1 Tax=Diploscapter pachys TaxID=2018661 RepID=A0A2A2JHP5_9BILA|nr:hypothetical protein WR25_06827 [Diploscapter pachys]